MKQRARYVEVVIQSLLINVVKVVICLFKFFLCPLPFENLVNGYFNKLFENTIFCHFVHF